ncbi:MAG: MarR family transcriptional regulator [Anaerolineales bacterium]|nr:MarR family transcriptional regulator [Anaerolineales bacterium]
MSAESFTGTLKSWIDISMRYSMRNFLRYARESGLSMSHFGALFHIHRTGSCGVTEVGEHLGVTSAAASQLLDRLVDQGMIDRTEDPQDRRVKRIVLTEQGQSVLEQGLQARQAWLDELEATLNADEKQQISAALDLLIERADQLSRSETST